MTKTKVKQRKCIYNECALPTNNNYYWWQLVFFLIGTGILISDSVQFTSLALFLFVTPILLNLFYNKLVPHWLNYVKFAYICFNAIIIIFCFFGIANLLVIDIGNAFKISEKALIGGEKVFYKKEFVFVILFNLLIPIMFYFGAPNQATIERVKYVKERLELKA